MLDPGFLGELEHLHRTYTGRPSLITEVPRFAEHAGGARVILKREDLNHTGSHKINNVLAQALLTKRMGKTRVIAETGAGQHGVATATAARPDGARVPHLHGQGRHRAAGAQRRPDADARRRGGPRRRTGSATLKDAINEALRDWVTNVDNTHYLLGTVAGPHPFPAMVRDFQRSSARRPGAGARPDRPAARRRHRLRRRRVQRDGHLPPFVDDPAVRLVGIEAGGEGIESGRHAARFAASEPGVLHGTFSYLMQDADGQTVESHSISAGLDYPGVGPEHSFLRDSGRAEYRYATDDRGDGGVRAAVQDRGHHPRDRVGPRPRRRHGAGHASSGPTRCCW